MLARASHGPKQTFTRCMRHGNFMNKKGIAASFQNSFSTSRNGFPMKMKKFHVVPTMNHPRSRQFGDMIVRAPAPKHEVEVSQETRFTLPDTPNNANIYDQIFWRSTDTMDDVFHELRTYHKVHTFATDSDHEIEVMA